MVLFSIAPLSQMPSNTRMSLMELSQSAVVDLQESLDFNEPFYVVVIEKECDSESRHNETFGSFDSRPPKNGEPVEGNTVIHVWKLIISSSTSNDKDESSRNTRGPNVVMKTIKVCTQQLPLPNGVGVVHASPAAGHLR